MKLPTFSELKYAPRYIESHPDRIPALMAVAGRLLNNAKESGHYALPHKLLSALSMRLVEKRLRTSRTLNCFFALVLVATLIYVLTSKVDTDLENGMNMYVSAAALIFCCVLAVGSYFGFLGFVTKPYEYLGLVQMSGDDQAIEDSENRLILTFESCTPEFLDILFDPADKMNLTEINDVKSLMGATDRKLHRLALGLNKAPISGKRGARQPLLRFIELMVTLRIPDDLIDIPKGEACEYYFEEAIKATKTEQQVPA